jgi:DNA-binding response OmpR family regulator
MNETITILVVDNDPDTLVATTRLLRSAGYFVLEAQTGAACIGTVLEKDPDIILLDMQLPDVSSYEVSRQIKGKRGMRQQVVLLSDSMISSDKQSKGKKNGAGGYQTSPIANRELLARIQAIVRIIWTIRDRDFLIEKLKKSLATTKTLSGILPICASCKKIRNDQNYWEEVELYVERHSTAEFTHGMCPDCTEMFYPEMNK